VTELAALVVLRPAGGAELGERAPITSDTVAEAMPSPEAVTLALGYFRGRGFQVTAASGPSFSIVAPKEHFEKEFGIRLDDVTLSAGLELPVERLSAEVASAVQAVLFTPPPDFGPTDFH
jgi:hypothetical protein